MVKDDNGTRVLTVGNFDGVHLGHARLLARMAEFNGIRTVYTFEHHTRDGQNGFLRLFPRDIDDMLLREGGAQEIIRADFEAVRNMTPEEFVDKVIIKINPAAVVCGDNFSFGINASGNADTLRDLLAVHGISAYVVPLVGNISTTAIKEALSNGDTDSVRAMLGRYWFLETDVTHGKRLGRRLGAATVNQTLYEGCALPKFGVYASICSLPEGDFPAVTNIGIRPTVDTNGIPNAETHILGYNGSLYGKHIRISLVSYLRGEKHFANLSELQNAIENDKKAASELLGRIKTSVPSEKMY